MLWSEPRCVYGLKNIIPDAISLFTILYICNSCEYEIYVLIGINQFTFKIKFIYAIPS